MDAFRTAHLMQGMLQGNAHIGLHFPTTLRYRSNYYCAANWNRQGKAEFPRWAPARSFAVVALLFGATIRRHDKEKRRAMRPFLAVGHRVRFGSFGRHATFCLNGRYWWFLAARRTGPTPWSERSATEARCCTRRVIGTPESTVSRPHLWDGLVSAAVPLEFATALSRTAQHRVFALRNLSRSRQSAAAFDSYDRFSLIQGPVAVPGG